MRIRNYLAHYSLASERALATMYRKDFKMKTFREPGAFLIARDARTRRPRFWNYLVAYLDVAEAMGKSLSISVDALI